MTIHIYLILLLFGLEFGSFANVCIYRWPRGGSVYSPRRSHCIWCKNKILWYDNIPVISFVFLKGRCRQCRGHISARYPFVELIVAVLWLITGYFLTPYEISARLIYQGLVLTTVLLLVITTFTDLDWKIIPDPATYFLGFIGIIASFWNPLLGDVPAQRFIGSLFGGIAGAGSLWLISETGRRIMKKEVMGWGDIKLLGALGTVVGFQPIVTIMFLASVLGGISSLIGLSFGFLKRHQYIPFGPFINAAAYIILTIQIKFPYILSSLWGE